MICILVHKDTYSQPDWDGWWVLHGLAGVSHAAINCCSLWYFPNLCFFLHCCAALTNSSHDCFDAREYASTVSFGVLMNLRVSLGSCWVSPSYSIAIWASAAKWRMICPDISPSWSSLFWCSHMSHDTSHIFCMSATVHCKLDFCDFMIFQMCSWWSLHLWNTQPSIILSHPILVCSVQYSVLGSLLDSVALAQSLSEAINFFHSWVSDPCSLSQLLRDCKLSIHCVRALGTRQWMICALSSTAAWHLGHCAIVHWPHHIMFFPCANWPVICFVAHHLCVECVSFNALFIASVSRSLSVDEANCNLDFQYCCAGGLFRAHQISLLWFFTIHWFEIINTRGSMGRILVTFAMYSVSMLALALRSTSMLSHASCWRTVGWPLSWWPLMCWNFTQHWICVRMFLQARRRSAWAVNGLMVFLLRSLSRTDFPSHATVRDPCIGLSFTMYCTVKRSPHRPAALLLKELWSPTLPGTVMVLMIQSMLLSPLIIHLHAPHCSWNDPSDTAKALPLWITSQICWSEPICSIFKFQSLASNVLLSWLIQLLSSLPRSFSNFAFPVNIILSPRCMTKAISSSSAGGNSPTFSPVGKFVS